MCAVEGIMQFTKGVLEACEDVSIRLCDFTLNSCDIGIYFNQTLRMRQGNLHANNLGLLTRFISQEY